MSLFAALEGAIAHGKFDEMKSFYGPESQAYFNADPAVTSMPESGSAVGPEAIAEAARSEFGGKTVHFNIATLFHQTASTGAPLLVATGKVHIGTHKFPFSHTVLLAPASEDTDSTAFYVRNEILTVTGAGVDLVSGGSAAAAAAIAIDDSSEEPAAPAEDVLQVEGSATAQPADTGARLPAPSARLPAAIHPKPSAAQAATEVTAPSMGGFEWDNDTASPAAAPAAASEAAPAPAAAPAVLPPAAAGLPPPSQDLLAQAAPTSNGSSTTTGAAANGTASTSTRGRRRRGAPKPSTGEAAPAAADAAPAAASRTGTRGAKPAGTRGAAKASPAASAAGTTKTGAAPAPAKAPAKAPAPAPAPAPAQQPAPAARQAPFSYAAALGTAGSAPAPAPTPAPQRRAAKPAAKPAAAAAAAPAPAPAKGVPSARLMARTAPPQSDVELSVFVRRSPSAPAITDADAVAAFSPFGADPRFIIRNPSDGGSFAVKFSNKASVQACLEAGTVVLGGVPATIEARTSEPRRGGGEGSGRSSRGGASRARRGNRTGAAGGDGAGEGASRSAGTRGRRGGAGRSGASRGAPARA